MNMLGLCSDWRLELRTYCPDDLDHLLRTSMGARIVAKDLQENTKSLLRCWMGFHTFPASNI